MPAGALVTTQIVSRNGDIAVPGLAPGNYKIGYSENAPAYSIYDGVLPASDYSVSGFYSSTRGAYWPADARDPTSTFFPYIQWMARRGISSGTAQPTGLPLFKPLDPVSRQAMAAFLFRYSNLGSG